MQLGLCTSAATHAAAIASSGLDYLEENVQNFLAPEGSEADFAQRLAQAADAARVISVACCFLPGTLRCVGPDLDEPRILRWATTAFARARRAGIDTVVFGSGGARRLPEGVSASAALPPFVALLATLAPLAARFGITLVLEPLNPPGGGTEVPSPRRAFLFGEHNWFPS